MQWDQTDRLSLRIFLGTPTGQKLLSYLRENRPGLPKEFRDPKNLGKTEDLQLLGAYSYKSAGWEECVETLWDIAQEPNPQSVTAFDYSDPNYESPSETNL